MNAAAPSRSPAHRQVAAGALSMREQCAFIRRRRVIHLLSRIGVRFRFDSTLPINTLKLVSEISSESPWPIVHSLLFRFD
jgi:hypothetical protein